MKRYQCDVIFGSRGTTFEIVLLRLHYNVTKIAPIISESK